MGYSTTLHTKEIESWKRKDTKEESNENKEGNRK